MARTLTRAWLPPTAAALVVGSLVAGCGSGKDYANRPRPASPVVITASITPRQVLVSPASFGAGSIVLVIANETGASHRVTLETDELGGSSPGIRQETAPINPQDTATIQKTLRRGTYEVRAGSSAAVPEEIQPAKLVIGRPRKNSNDRLLLP